jgi:hypothetical protein
MTSHPTRSSRHGDSHVTRNTRAHAQHGLRENSVSPLDVKADIAVIAADFDMSRFWADFDLSKAQSVKKPKTRRKRKPTPEMMEKIRLATAILEEHFAEQERNRAAQARKRTVGSADDCIILVS